MWDVLADSLHFFLLLAALHCVSWLLSRRLLHRFGEWRGRRGTEVASMLAYNAVTLLVDLASSYVGVRAQLDGTAEIIAATARERIYGRSARYELLARWTVAFELYNMCICTTIPEYRTARFLGHHVVTLVLCLFSLRPAPMVHYYGFYFLGVAMLSTAALCVVEMANILRERLAALQPVHAASRGVFAVLFFGLRAVYWPWLSLHFWVDAVSLLTARTPSFASDAPLYYALLANVYLTSLQFLWGGRVARVIRAVSSSNLKDA